MVEVVALRGGELLMVGRRTEEPDCGRFDERHCWGRVFEGMEICWTGLDSFMLFWSASLRRLERFAAAEVSCAEEVFVIVDYSLILVTRPPICEIG